MIRRGAGLFVRSETSGGIRMSRRQQPTIGTKEGIVQICKDARRICRRRIIRGLKMENCPCLNHAKRSEDSTHGPKNLKDICTLGSRGHVLQRNLVRRSGIGSERRHSRCRSSHRPGLRRRDRERELFERNAEEIRPDR